MTEEKPDAWLVPWFRANGDSGMNVYIRRDDAVRAADNLEKYSSSETTADIIPLYAHAKEDPINLPGHEETMAGLDSLTIRK